MYSGTWLAEQTGVKAPVAGGGQHENLADGCRSAFAGGEKFKRAVTYRAERSVVGDGDTARGDLAGLLGPGDVAVNISIDRALRALRALKETHENLTSSGKASPALKPLVILVVVKLSEVKVVSGR
jgi:hypothetical protein